MALPAFPAAGSTAESAERAERAKRAEVPIEVEAVPVSAQPVGLPSVNLLSGLLPSSLQPCAVAAPTPSVTPPAPWSPSSGYLGAVATPLGAATAQAAPLPATSAAEVPKDWTELEDEEILRRPRAAPAHRAPAPRHTPTEE